KRNDDDSNHRGNSDIEYMRNDDPCDDLRLLERHRLGCLDLSGRDTGDGGPKNFGSVRSSCESKSYDNGGETIQRDNTCQTKIDQVKRQESWESAENFDEADDQ